MLAEGDQSHPTACACKWHLTFDDAIPAIDLNSRTARLLSELSCGLEQSGGRLIGHVKGMIDADEKGHLLFSITSFEEGARFKGEMVGRITEAVLTINVIVYGVEEETVEKVLEEAFNRHFHGDRCWDHGGEGHAQ
ncbi:MAG: hypothetical protein JRS35_10100 [Deltaproteobacteria bacterium]|nr:hypothetical protein [Deltaproteobacteria bacterium]